MNNSKLKITKIIISFLIFFIGVWSSIYISSITHIFLTDNTLKLITIKEGLFVIKNSKNALILFILITGVSLLISLAYYLLNDKFYESELIEITPEIKIPKVAGQMQFGSARFMTEEEKGKYFGIFQVGKALTLLEKKEGEEDKD